MYDLINNIISNIVDNFCYTTCSIVPSVCDCSGFTSHLLILPCQMMTLLFFGWCLSNYPFIQETAGYFFCLEDRALLCRKCDVAIHTVNDLVSSHQRFLLTGVKVGLEAADNGGSSSTEKSDSGEKILEPEKPHSVPAKIAPISTTNQFNKFTPVQAAAGAGDFVPPKLPFSGGSSGDSLQQWQFEDFLTLTDFNQNYNYLDNFSSKVTNTLLSKLHVMLLHIVIFVLMV